MQMHLESLVQSLQLPKQKGVEFSMVIEDLSIKSPSLRLSKMSSSPPSSMGSSLTPWPSLSGYTPKKAKKGKKGKVSTKSFESARKELDKLLKQGKVRSRSR